MREGILTLDDFKVEGKLVLLRCDINSPIDWESRKIKDTTRIKRSVPTVKELSEKGAKVVILAHQADPLDYQNFTSLREHRDYLEEFTGKRIQFIEDIAGPYALDKIKGLKPGEILLLENIRLYTEETIIFEKEVGLSPEEQTQTYLVRRLSPLADIYICDAFAAVHRSEPSLVAFPLLLPSGAGRLFEEELEALSRVKTSPQKPCIYLLGGAKILDAFHMMRTVLKENTADFILTFGLVGQIFLKAKGYFLGKDNEEFLEKKGLLTYTKEAKSILDEFADRVIHPVDVALDRGRREEFPVTSIPSEGFIKDIGEGTIKKYLEKIKEAKTIFMNGPAGVYEEENFQKGTEQIWREVADSSAFKVIGGGDTIMAAKKFGVEEKFSYICTAGGGMVRFLSGEKLPVIEALRTSARKFKS